MKYKLFVALAACSLAVAQAEEVRRDSAIIDRGILTHASSGGVFRLNVATGAFEITYAKGRVHQDILRSYLPIERNMLANVPFLLLQGKGSGEKDGAVCESEAEVVTDAVNLVTRACVNMASALCASARDTLGEALIAFNNCLLQTAQQPIGDGSSQQPPGNGTPTQPNGG